MRDLTRFYRLFGERTVFLPVREKSKVPVSQGWQETTFEDTQTVKYKALLVNCANLGVLQGAPSCDLVSIDFDDDQYYEIFLSLNPWAGNTLQTRGNRGRNVWLRMRGDYPHRVVRLSETGEKGVGEWRGGGCQTVVDGIHENGTSRYSIINEARVL
jgi:hypothetical protein